MNTANPDPIALGFMAIVLAICAWIIVNPEQALFWLSWRMRKPSPRMALIMRLICAFTGGNLLIEFLDLALKRLS